MDQPIKTYLAQQLIGKTLHFHCSCIIPIDDTGTIKDYELDDNEIIFVVDFHGKIVRLGENHPNLTVREA